MTPALLKKALVNAHWQQLAPETSHLLPPKTTPPLSRVRHPQPPAIIFDWLADEGSLTQRLIDYSNQQFRVELLNQQQEHIIDHEATALKLARNSRASIREVLLYCREQAVVFARTVIPPNTLTGKQQELGKLDNKPLGAYLFAQKDMVRDPIEYTCLHIDKNPPVWGRRSVFYLSAKPLLVTEIFLPALFQTPENTLTS